MSLTDDTVATTRQSAPAKVDPRGLRVAAAITAVVVALVLVLPSPAREILLAIQVAVFAIAAFAGLTRSPYSIFFAKVIRPRIGAPAELEDSRPPRFAQLVGFTFTAVALLAFLAGATTAGLVATAFALIAALLNASIGLCLGCELYLLLRRLTPAKPEHSITSKAARTTHAPHTNGGTA